MPTEDQPKKSRNQRILHLKQAVQLVWKSAPGWSIATVVLFAVQGLLPLLSLYLIKLIIDSVSRGISAPDTASLFPHVAFLIALAGGVALLSSLCGSAAELIKEHQAQIVTDSVMDILHEQSVKVDLEYYENSDYHDTLHRAQQQTPYLPARIVNGLMQAGLNAISLLAMASLLAYLHWGIGLILLVASLPGVVVRLRYSKKIYKWQRKRTKTQRRAQYMNHMLTGDQYAKEVRMFSLGALFVQRFQALQKQLRQERLKIVTRRASAEAVTKISSVLAVFGAFAYIAYKAMLGMITVGDLVMYFQAFQRGQGYLQGTFGALAGLYENSLYLSDLYEFLGVRPKITAPTDPVTPARPMQKGIALHSVSFHYPGTNRAVLQDINMTIRPGEHIALVAENGTGKTTLVKLLCRLYDPTEGSITLDGTDIRCFNPAALRREFSIVFQDYAKYHLTAQENIWLGDVDLPPDDKKIITAAQLSGADKALSKLPNGYDSILGRWFENGEELSIGEWQKVALARAFLRNSQIVILDEPTSSMDARAEYEVFQKFHQLTRGRTAILISHRLSTVRMADCIYVLDKGRITESGTHDQLMKHDGNYASLFATQAHNYNL